MKVLIRYIQKPNSNSQQIALIVLQVNFSKIRCKYRGSRQLNLELHQEMFKSELNLIHKILMKNKSLSLAHKLHQFFL